MLSTNITAAPVVASIAIATFFTFIKELHAYKAWVGRRGRNAPADFIRAVIGALGVMASLGALATVSRGHALTKQSRGETRDF